MHERAVRTTSQRAEDQAAAELLRTLSGSSPIASFGSLIDVPLGENHASGAKAPIDVKEKPTCSGVTASLHLLPPSKGKAHPKSISMWAASDQNPTHPILRLGWKPLCQVVCNGLTGVFLGGHDRDLYIRCTAPEYADKPCTDVSSGGCIMSCSQFERAAGRELSKKWKESIHVGTQPGGTKSTLIAWLKRRAEEKYGSAILGRTLWVCWPADAEWYQGTVVGYSKDTGKHSIRYSSTMSEQLHLPAERISFDPIKPSLAPVSPSNTELPPRNMSGFMFAPLPMHRRRVSAGAAAAPPSEDVEAEHYAPPSAAPLGEEAGASSGGGPPQRSLSAPASVLISEALATVQEEKRKRLRQEGFSSDVVSAPAPPPALKIEEHDCGVMRKWLHQLALDLDTDLESFQRSIPGILEHCPLSGVFQGVVALNDEHVVRGVYEGAVLRYLHFETMGSVPVLRHKMAEYVVGVCQCGKCREGNPKAI